MNGSVNVALPFRFLERIGGWDGMGSLFTLGSSTVVLLVRMLCNPDLDLVRFFRRSMGGDGMHACK